MHLWAFIALFLCTPVSVTAFFGATNDTSFWDDFANNFATDLAPIVSLFGEQVTKQFLSESTTILDSIIFAVGPLGILTAIVSCIRACGGSFLKSLVGRAREPDSVSEIEVCSSTSDSVCEVLSNGGICRVFGRPKLLEFIYRPMSNPSKFYDCIEEQGNRIPAECGIESTKQFFRRIQPRRGDAHGSDASESMTEWKEDPATEIPRLPIPTMCKSWVRCFGDKFARSPRGSGSPSASDVELAEQVQNDGSHTDQGSDQGQDEAWNPDEHGQSLENGFAPFPNLALNIGVQESSTTTLSLRIAAIFGVLLQLSFFGYVTWASWYHPSFYKGQGSVNPILFFTFTMAGTASVVVGMFLSARLIDGNSKERRFSRQKGDYIFWLQAGDQSIGDQQFDAFACNERKTKYITSWKVSDGRPKTKRVRVWLAVGLSFLGWVFQFIGLRGQHATISLYLLCCTVIMSVVRAFLRSFRSIPENQLHRLKMEVKGHELDWQALNFAYEKYGVMDFFDHQPSAKDEAICWAVDGSNFDGSDCGLASYHTSRDLKTAIGENFMIAIVYTEGFEELIARDTARWTEDGTNNLLDLSRYCHKIRVNPTKGEEMNEKNEWKGVSPNPCAKLMRIRSRLAFIREWNTEVRTTAQHLEKVLQKSAKLFDELKLFDMKFNVIAWSTSCQLWQDSRERSGAFVVPPGTISFQMIRRNRGGWTTDVNQLEAVLGLWSWTMKGILNTNDPLEKRIIIEERGSYDIPRLMRYWTCPVSWSLGPCNAQQTNLSIPAAIPADYSRIFDQHRSGRESGDDKERMGFTTTSSLLQLAAQDIFTIFIERVGMLLQYSRLSDIITGEVSLVEKLAELLISEKLATRDDAVMSILPALIMNWEYAEGDGISRSLISRAHSLARKANFGEARRCVLCMPLRHRDRAHLEMTRSELRWMIQQHSKITYQDLFNRKAEMEVPDDRVYGDVFNWLLSDLADFRGPEYYNPILKDIQYKYDASRQLNKQALNDLGLDNITRWDHAHLHALTLADRFTLAKSHASIRKQLLRWAIEWNCTGLVADLWDAELKQDSGDGNDDRAFSGGSDELFWAVTRLIPNDCMNSGLRSWPREDPTTPPTRDIMSMIWFLLDVVGARQDTPLRLRVDLDQQWWETSRQRDHMKKKYEDFRSVLFAASADPNGLEVVQALLQKTAAAELSVHDVCESLEAAANSGSLKTIHYVLSKWLRDDGYKDDYGAPLKIVAKWGLKTYVEHLLKHESLAVREKERGDEESQIEWDSRSEMLRREGSNRKYSQIALDEIRNNPLSDEEEQRAKDVLGADRDGVLEVLKERLQELPAGLSQLAPLGYCVETRKPPQPPTMPCGMCRVRGR